jgi:hypothetical protein
VHKVKEKEYHRLCKTCDKILLSNQAIKPIIANTWLHILREHPDFLRNYQSLFQSLSQYQLIKQNLLTLVRFTTVSFVRLFQSIGNRKFWHTSNNVKQSDFLFISHLTNRKFIGQSNDFYFHDLPSQLMAKNISVNIALINHIKLSNDGELTPWKYNPIAHIVLNSTLTLLDELKLYYEQLKSITILNKICNQLCISRTFKQKALIHTMSFDTANVLRISKQIALLTLKTKPKYIVLTYEGHAWERLVFYEARKIDPNIKCIGYQHAAISHYQHAIKRDLSASYNPDIILTAGIIAKKQLDEAPHLLNTSIMCLGSPKSQNLKLQNIIKLSTCLVIPEGIISECLLLFKFSLLCAKAMPNYQFIWRLHPLLDFDMLQKYSDIFYNLPDNIQLSERSIKADIEQCDSVLYRGSTAVINAINAGLRPIYYRQNDEMSIDPIYQHVASKSIVRSVDDFMDVVSEALHHKEQVELNQFSNLFYTPLNSSILIKIMSID